MVGYALNGSVNSLLRDLYHPYQPQVNRSFDHGTCAACFKLSSRRTVCRVKLKLFASDLVEGVTSNLANGQGSPSRPTSQLLSAGNALVNQKKVRLEQIAERGSVASYLGSFHLPAALEGFLSYPLTLQAAERPRVSCSGDYRTYPRRSRGVPA